MKSSMRVDFLDPSCVVGFSVVYHPVYTSQVLMYYNIDGLFGGASTRVRDPQHF